MKPVLPFYAFVVLFASCTTAYKSGQTPDDVYFSPARPQEEYVRTENKQDQYYYDEQIEDDRYLRMKVRNRRTWSDLDYYYSDPFAYNYRYYNRFNTYGSVYYNTPWNYYSSWNYHYNPYNTYYNPYYFNPYGSKVIVVNPRQQVYNRPRTFNLNPYNQPLNNGYDRKSSTSNRIYRGDNRDFDYNTNNESTNSGKNNSGRSLRTIFNNNTSTQQSQPSRSERPTSTPSSSPSRSTNAPVRKF